MIRTRRAIQTGGLLLSVFSLTFASAGCSDKKTEKVGSGDPAWLETLTYRGAFRLNGNDEGDDRRLGYSNGIIAIDGLGNLWVASHAYSDMFAPFPIPAAFGATLDEAPVTDQGSSWTDVTQGVQAQIDADREILGLLRVADGWLYTVHEYYNGDASHDPVMGYDGNGLWMTTHHSQATAGYVAEVHPDWRARLGGDFIVGLAGTTIHQPASHGPVAHVFSFDPAQMPTADATVVTERLLFYPLYEEHEDFTHVSRIRGAAFAADALYLFGRRGLGEHWYGESNEGGNSDPCSGSKGYHSEALTSWVWIIDPADLEAVRQGGDPRVPTVYSGSMDDLLGLSGSCTSINGASYDRAAGLIFVTADDTVHTGMEPQPAVYVLEVANP